MQMCTTPEKREDIGENGNPVLERRNKCKQLQFYQEIAEIALGKMSLSKLAHLCIIGEGNEFFLLQTII